MPYFFPTSGPTSAHASGSGTLLRDRPMADREAVLKGVFAAMSEGVVIRGHAGEILEANAAALTILGLSLDELTGRTPLHPLWQTVREDGFAFPGSEHPAMVTLRTGQPVREQIMGVDDPKRGLRWLSIHPNPIWGCLLNTTDASHDREVSVPVVSC